MTSLNERLRQGLAAAVITTAAATAGSANAMHEVQIAQQAPSVSQTGRTASPSVRPTTKATTPPAKKRQPASKQSPTSGQDVYEGGCGPAR